jgi:large repetitive protein
MNWLRRTRFPQLWPDLILTLVGTALLIAWLVNGRPLPPPFGAAASPSLASPAANLKVGENAKVSGTTDPDMFVYLLDDKGSLIAQGYADATGAFALDVPAQVAEGKRNYSVYTAIDGNAFGFLGPIGVSAPAPFEVAVAAPVVVAQVEPTATPQPTAAPTATIAPTATTKPTDAPKPTATAAATSTAAATATPKPAGLTIKDPVAGSVALASDIKTVSGTSAPGAEVEVIDGDRLLGKVKADADGKWTFTLPRALVAGAHLLTAVSGADKSEAVAVLAVTKPVIAQVQAPRPATETPLNGNATAGATVAVTASDKVVCTATAADDGKWTCNLAADLAVEKQTLKVSVVNADAKAVVEGNQIEVNFTPLLPVTGAD